MNISEGVRELREALSVRHVKYLVGLSTKKIEWKTFGAAALRDSIVEFFAARLATLEAPAAPLAYCMGTPLELLLAIRDILSHCVFDQPDSLTYKKACQQIYELIKPELAATQPAPEVQLPPNTQPDKAQLEVPKCGRCGQWHNTEDCPNRQPAAAPAEAEKRGAEADDLRALAEHIAYLIQSLLTNKYTNSFKIAHGIIEQELLRFHESRPAPAPESQPRRDGREANEFNTKFIGDWPIEVDPAIPPNEVHMRDSAGTVHKITNIGASAGSEAAPPSTRNTLVDIMVGNTWEQSVSNFERVLAEERRKGVAAGLEEAAMLYEKMGWNGVARRIRALDPEAIAKRVSEGRVEQK